LTASFPQAQAQGTAPDARARLREGLIAAALVAGGAFVMAQARQLPLGVQTDPLGPRFFPFWLGAGTAACGLLLAAGVLVGRDRLPRFGSTLMADVSEEEEEPGAPFSLGRLLAAAAVTGLYVAAFEPVGYLLATPVYVAAIALIHGGTGRRALLLAPAIVTAVLYLSFRFALFVPLPPGLLQGVLP
jgi:putative tricarboxylic transport membrane protein